MAQTRSEVLDTHWSSTRSTVEKKVIDNYFEDYPTVGEYRKSALQMIDGGGRQVDVKVRTSGGTAGSFSEYDVLPKNPINPVETGEYIRRYYYAPIIISQTEEWENSSAEKIFDELKEYGDIAMQDIIKAINEDFYSAQVGKNILGYQDIIADAAGTTVAGIAPATSAVWENQRETGATTFLTVSNNIVAGIDLWNDLMDSIMMVRGRPTTLFATWSIGRAYRVALSSQGYARTTVESAGGVGGSHQPPFYDMKLILDNDCTALHSYMIDPRHEKLRVMRQVNFKKTPFVTLQSNGQLAQLAYMVAGVTHTCDSRRRQGVTTALTGT